MMFTIFDITIFTIIIISAILGLYKGMLNIVINLLGFIASIVAAIILFPYIKALFIGHIENQLFASIFSGVVAYILSLVVLTFVTSKVITLFNPISGGVFDRFLGVIFGVLRGLIFSAVLFTVVAVLSSGSYLKAQNGLELVSNLDTEKYPEWLSSSKTSNFLEGLLKSSVLFLPEDTLKSITLPKTNIEKDKEVIDDNQKDKILK